MWLVSLLTFSVLAVWSLRPGASGIWEVVAILYFTSVPGYALSLLLLPALGILERVIVSMALSFAMFVGLEQLADVAGLQIEPGFGFSLLISSSALIISLYRSLKFR